MNVETKKRRILIYIGGGGVEKISFLFFAVKWEYEVAPQSFKKEETKLQTGMFL